MLLVAGRKKKGREREREKSSERLEGGGPFRQRLAHIVCGTYLAHSLSWYGL